MKKKFYLSLFILFLTTGFLFPDVPNEIEYQGRLKESGEYVNGLRNMKFNIYSTPTEGLPVWTSENISVNVSSGVFSCILSPDVDWRNSNYWIETIVESKVFSPRQKITSQVYSLHSKTSEDISKLNSPIYFSIGTSTVAKISSEKFNIDVSTLNVQGKIKEYGNDLLPRGVIVMWSGSIANIPPGWALCDGQTYIAPDGTQVTTPDLRDRFIVGAGAMYSVGTTGGEAFHTLTIFEIPNHSHNFSGTTSSDGAHSHKIWAGTIQYNYPYILLKSDSAGVGWWSNYTSTEGEHTHTFSGTTSSIGSNAAHENRPPYYALAFIMKL